MIQDRNKTGGKYKYWNLFCEIQIPREPGKSQFKTFNFMLTNEVAKSCNERDLACKSKVKFFSIPRGVDTLVTICGEYRIEDRIRRVKKRDCKGIH